MPRLKCSCVKDGNPMMAMTSEEARKLKRRVRKLEAALREACRFGDSMIEMAMDYEGVDPKDEDDLFGEYKAIVGNWKDLLKEK